MCVCVCVSAQVCPKHACMPFAVACMYRSGHMHACCPPFSSTSVLLLQVNLKIQMSMPVTILLSWSFSVISCSAGRGCDAFSRLGKASMLSMSESDGAESIRFPTETELIYSMQPGVC